MSDTNIRIAEDFSRYPGGRYKKDGPWSGEEFREDLLMPSLTKNRRVRIVLDGVVGFPSSFLEESFGGLVRRGIAFDALKQLLSIDFSDPALAPYEELIWEHIEAESRRSALKEG